MKHTSPDHPDHANLESAADKMGQVAAFVNEHKRDFENMTKVNAIQSMFVGKFDVCYPLPNSLQTFSFDDDDFDDEFCDRTLYNQIDDL